MSAEVEAAIAWLKRHGTKATRDGMARYNIPSDHAFGVSVKNIQVLAKQLGKNHALAEALWKTGWYEARLLAGYVDEPDRVTAAQMDRWCRDFDNWGDLRHGVLRAVRSDAACMGEGGEWATRRKSSSSARPSHCCGASRCTTERPPMRHSSARCRSSSVRRPMNGIWSRRPSIWRCGRREADRSLNTASVADRPAPRCIERARCGVGGQGCPERTDEPLGRQALSAK